MSSTPLNDDQRLRRWRLVLGAEAACDRSGGEGIPFDLTGDDLQMDRVLEALYDSDRSAGLGASCPNVNRWLGGGTDINRAVGYCRGLIGRPAQTIFVLITDLFEGGDVPATPIAGRGNCRQRREHGLPLGTERRRRAVL